MVLANVQQFCNRTNVQHFQSQKQPNLIEGTTNFNKPFRIFMWKVYTYNNFADLMAEQSDPSIMLKTSCNAKQKFNHAK